MPKSSSQIVGSVVPGERGPVPQLPPLSWAGGEARGNAHVAVAS